MKRILIFIFSIAMFYGFYLLIKEQEKYNYDRCGTIVAMKDGFDVVIHHKAKRADHAELENRMIIVANFSGNIESHDVGENTYFRKRIGDQICFQVNDGEFGGWALLAFILGGASLIYLIFTSKYY